MITDKVYVEIELLRRHGLSLRRIAAEVGCAVNTVRAHLASPDLPRYERKVQRVTKLAPFEAYLREGPAAAHPHWIPASVLMREIVAQGYQGGASQLRAFMHMLKPAQPSEPVVRQRPTGERVIHRLLSPTGTLEPVDDRHNGATA